MLNYYRPIKSPDGVIYSCDMLRMNLIFRSDKMQNIEKYLNSDNRIDVTAYPINLTNFRFRYMWKIDYIGSTMVLAMSMNGSTEDKYKGFIEFNPNKTMQNPMIEDDLKFIVKCCTDVSVCRWDLAIDFPVNREYVHMVKDKRKYGLEMTSYDSRTEYLGRRDCEGRVKVYNKRVESELDYDLTRLEITMGKLKNIRKQFDDYTPMLWFQHPQHNLITDDTLSDTQRVLIQLLQACDNPELYLKQLQYRQRKKIEPYVIGDNTKLIPEYKYVSKVIENIFDLFSFTKLNIT